MSVLPIVKIGHPVLRKKTTPVKKNLFNAPELSEFIEKMVQTMHAAEGVGLAANQVAAGINLAVLECRSNRRYPGRDDFALEAFANIRILKYSKKKVVDWEGCLSIPCYRGLVPRSKSVTFEAQTPDGKTVRRTVSGFHARVIQHETDHLNGLFYIDRMEDMKSFVCIEPEGS